MRTYFVYIHRTWVKGEYQRRVAATQVWARLDSSNREEVPAIWRVKDCNGSEHAKGVVLDFLTFPNSMHNNQQGRVTRIR